MSKLETNQVDPATGTTLTLGTSGDTIAVPSGVTIANSGTATGFGKVLQVISTTKTDTFFGIVLGNTFDIGKPTDATVGAASLSTDFFVKNAQTLTSLSMAGSTNGAMVGPVTISGTITIPSGSTFVIL